MQIIKYCMLFFVFLGVATIGRSISQKYKFRVDELEELKNTLNILKSKIKFTYEPIPEIFEQIKENSSKNISELFTNIIEKMQTESAGVAWEKAVDEYNGYLKVEDKNAIKTISKLLRDNWCRRTT